MPRIEVLWRPLTNHLLEVCQHRHIRMREWGVEAITYLVKSALQYKHSQPLKENMVNLDLILILNKCFIFKLLFELLSAESCACVLNTLHFKSDCFRLNLYLVHITLLVVSVFSFNFTISQ